MAYASIKTQILNTWNSSGCPNSFSAQVQLGVGVQRVEVKVKDGKFVAVSPFFQGGKEEFQIPKGDLKDAKPFKSEEIDILSSEQHPHKAIHSRMDKRG